MAVIRPRLPEDLPACVEVLKLVHRKDGYPMSWPTEPEKRIASEREYAAWVALNEEDTICGHISLHKVVGHDACEMWTKATSTPSNSIGAIARLYVAPSERKSGVGKDLMEIATQKAWELKLHPVLDVGQYNLAAARLYERLGWKRIGQLDKREIPIFLYLGPPEKVLETL